MSRSIEEIQKDIDRVMYWIAAYAVYGVSTTHEGWKVRLVRLQKELKHANKA